MYCPSCGSSVLPTLSYCNHCGAKLNAAEDRPKPAAASPDSLVWAIVAVTIAGLGLTIGMMSVLKHELHFNDDIIILFGLLTLSLIVAVDAAFLWQFMRRKAGGDEIGSATQLRGLITKELNAARALGEPAPTVTEHTTRSIDSVFSERKAE